MGVPLNLLKVRLKIEIMALSVNGDTVSECSEASTLIDGSVISTVPDRHGFLGESPLKSSFLKVTIK